MASRISLSELSNSLKGIETGLKGFLSQYDKAIDQIKTDSTLIKKNLDHLDAKTPKGFLALNKALAEAEKLSQQREKTDQQRKKTEQELVKVLQQKKKVEQEHQKTIIAGEKIAEQRKKNSLLQQKIDEQKIKNVKHLDNNEKEALKTKLLVIRTQEAEARQLKRISDEQKKVIAETEKQSKATALLNNKYKQLTISTDKAQNEFKQLAAEFGVGSKKAEVARKKFEKLDTN